MPALGGPRPPWSGSVTAPDGEVADGGGRLRILDGRDGPVLADVPAASLSDDAPLYHRPLAPAGRPRARAGPTTPAALAAPTTAAPTSLAMLVDPRWVWRQYDHQLFLNTVAGPGGDAAVLRLAAPGLPASERGLALSTDGNPRWCASTPGPARPSPWPSRP